MHTGWVTSPRRTRDESPNIAQGLTAIPLHALQSFVWRDDLQSGPTPERGVTPWPLVVTTVGDGTTPDRMQVLSHACEVWGGRFTPVKVQGGGWFMHAT